MTGSRCYAVVFCTLLITIVALGQEAEQDRDTLVVQEFALAVQLYNDGMYDLALNQFRKIMETHPGSIQGIKSRYYLGLVYKATGEYENARFTLQTFALTYPENPNAPDAWWNIAEMFETTRRYLEAAGTLERFVQFYPDHIRVPNALYYTSIYYEQAGDLDRAESFLKRIILQYGTADIIHQTRLRFGHSLKNKNEFKKAAAVFERITQDIAEPVRDPELKSVKAEAFLGLANAYGKQRFYDQAERAYQHITKEYADLPVYPAALLGLADIYQAKGEHQQAIDNYRMAQQAAEETDPPNKEIIRQQVFLGIARSHTALGDYSSAITFYDLFARLYAASIDRSLLVDVWIGMAQSYEKLNNPLQANEWWNRVIDTTTGTSKENALIRASQNYIEANDYHRAADRLRQYVESFDTQNTPRALFTLAKLYEDNLNEHRNALETYERLAYRYPTSPFIDDAVLGQVRTNIKLGNDRNAYHILQQFPERYRGSSLLAEARDLKEKLEIFHLQDREKGFEQITHLMSEIIVGSPRGELALRLGEIYLELLKQYAEASRQFSVALSADLPPDKKTRAEYLYGHSLYRVAQANPAQQSESLLKLRELIDQNPRSQNIDALQFFYHDLLRNVAPPQEFVTTAERFIQSFPRSTYRDRFTYYLAQAYLKMGDHSKSIDLYRTLITSYPTSPLSETTAIELAGLHIEQNDTSTAIEILSSYLRRNPDGTKITEALSTLGNLYKGQKNFQRAIEYYRQFIERFPYNNDIREIQIGYIECLFHLEQYAEAYEYALALVTDDDTNHFHTEKLNNTDLFYIAATSAYRIKNINQAQTLYERFVTHDSESLRAAEALIILSELYKDTGNTYLSGLYSTQSDVILGATLTSPLIASFYWQREQYNKAAAHYSRLVQATTDETLRQGYETNEIIALLRNRNLDRAQQRITSYRQAYPRDRETIVTFTYESALVYFRNRSFDTAARNLEQFIRDNRNSELIPHAHFYLGRTWESVGRFRDAQRKYEEILTQFPSADILPQVNLALANLFLRQEKYIEAIDHYRIIIENTAYDDKLMYYTLQNLSVAYEEIGFFDAASELLNEFISRYPYDSSIPDKRVKIGALHQLAGNYESSISIFQDLLLYANRELEVELRYYTGDSYHMMGNYPRAITEFMMIGQLDTRTSQLDWTATAYYMAGQSYEQMGKYEQAITTYQKIIDGRGIDQTYKAAARREIDRVRNVMRQIQQ